MIESFSTRHGYRPAPAKISVREDAPEILRDAIPLIAKNAGMSPSAMREKICEVLLVRPDPTNWSEYPNIHDEVYFHLANAPWHKVYDIAEVLYAAVANMNPLDSEAADKFERRLNDFFVENGIGWELRDGQIIHRGSEAFERSTHKVPDLLSESGFQRAANEMREALQDISRRPEADITGAIQHAMASLEATAREVTGQLNPTFGGLVTVLDLPKPLDQAVSKLWGYASDRGRHIREHQDIGLAEAELIVAVAGSLCEFVLERES